MPLYDYHCKKCGDTFEVMQKFSDAPLTTHEACGGDLEKLLSAPAFQFKGTGWYVTDYARGGNSPAKSNGKSESKSDSGSSESKSESKSEKKAEPAKSTTTDK